MNFNSNSTGGSVSVDSPLVQIYASPNIGSARAAAGYESDVAAGTHPYSWTINNDPRRIDAAAFGIVPEPSILLLIGLGSLALFVVRLFIARGCRKDRLVR